MATDTIDNARGVFAQRLRAARTERRYTQAEVASKVGVAQTTIANYEQGTRFPEETTLRRLADLFDVTIDWLFGRSPNPLVPTQPPLENPSDLGPEVETVKVYLETLLAGDRDGAARLVEKAERDGWGTKKIYSDLFEPALKECGLRWMQGEIDIAQEHFITHLTEVFMAQVLSRAPLPPRSGYSLIGASILGDLHNIGVRMVCDFLELEGWTTYYFGNDLPTESIVGAVVKIKPSVLALSATMRYAVESVAAVIRALRRSGHDPGTAVIVGGSAFNSDANLWQQVGADGWAASAGEAVLCAKRLVGDQSDKAQTV